MAGPISTLPQIIPNLFGMTGQAVQKSVGDAISPTLEILDLLATTNCLELVLPAVQNIAASGLVRVPELTVPQTEAWLVRGCSLITSTGAAELFRGKLVQGRTTSLGDVAIREHGQAMTSLVDAAAVGLGSASTIGPAFTMFAGDFLGVAVERITTAGTIPVTFRALIYRFTV